MSLLQLLWQDREDAAATCMLHLKQKAANAQCPISQFAHPMQQATSTSTNESNQHDDETETGSLITCHSAQPAALLTAPSRMQSTSPNQQKKRSRSELATGNPASYETQDIRGQHRIDHALAYIGIHAKQPVMSNRGKRHNDDFADVILCINILHTTTFLMSFMHYNDHMLCVPSCSLAQPRTVCHRDGPQQTPGSATQAGRVRAECDSATRYAAEQCQVLDDSYRHRREGGCTTEQACSRYAQPQHSVRAAST